MGCSKGRRPPTPLPGNNSNQWSRKRDSTEGIHPGEKECKFYDRNHGVITTHSVSMTPDKNLNDTRSNHDVTVPITMATERFSMKSKVRSLFHYNREASVKK